MPNKRSLLAWFLVLALSALAGVAGAQPRFVTAPRRGDDLATATQRLAQQAAAEPGGRFARVARELAREAPAVRGRPDTRGRFDQLYVRARRLLVSERAQPSEALLDAWDAVVASYAPLRRVAAPVPLPQEPPPPSIVYSFQGSFERTPVQLAGRTLDELDRSCLTFVSAIETRMVDDVTMGTQQVHNGPGYWDAQALCSIAVLNASGPQTFAPALARGSIEGVPFSVDGSRDDVARILQTHIPRVVRQMRVDDVELNGQQYHNGPTFWSAEQIVSLIVAQLGGGGRPLPPPPPRGRPWSAQGSIENIPFSFTSPSQQDMDTQCRAFVASAVTDWIDDIQIDGRSLHNGSGWWTAEQACQIISTQSRQL